MGAGLWSHRLQTNSGFLSSLLYENSSHLFNSSFFVAFSPGLSLPATPLLFQTTLPSRGFRTRWGFRKSLCQLLRALAPGSGAAFHICGVGQRELGNHMSLCTHNKLLIPWLVESLGQEAVWHSQGASFTGVTNDSRSQVFGNWALQCHRELQRLRTFTAWLTG